VEQKMERKASGVAIFVNNGWSCHIYIKKYLNANKELRKFKYFTMQKYNLQKNPLKQTKIFQDIIAL
jgi:hypothetical protein